MSSSEGMVSSTRRTVSFLLQATSWCLAGGYLLQSVLGRPAVFQCLVWLGHDVPALSRNLERDTILDKACWASISCSRCAIRCYPAVLLWTASASFVQTLATFTLAKEGLCIRRVYTSPVQPEKWLLKRFTVHARWQVTLQINHVCGYMVDLAGTRNADSWIIGQRTLLTKPQSPGSTQHDVAFMFSKGPINNLASGDHLFPNWV